MHTQLPVSPLGRRGGTSSMAQSTASQLATRGNHTRSLPHWHTASQMAGRDSHMCVFLLSVLWGRRKPRLRRPEQAGSGIPKHLVCWHITPPPQTSGTIRHGLRAHRHRVRSSDHSPRAYKLHRPPPPSSMSWKATLASHRAEW
jgi:hypothetical protein